MLHSGCGLLNAWTASSACTRLPHGGACGLVLYLSAASQPIASLADRPSSLLLLLTAPALLQLLALTNLTHKATHSTQTALSHFRREGESQVWLPKPAVTQTPVSGGTDRTGR